MPETRMCGRGDEAEARERADKVDFRQEQKETLDNCRGNDGLVQN